MTARRLLGWWAALFGLWLLLVGQWTQLVAVWGGGLALLATAAGATVAAQGRFRATFRLRWLGELRSAVLAAVVDSGVVAAALADCIVTRRHHRGEFVRDESAAGDDEEAVARRAWVELVATWSPNSYVIDISPENGGRLLHDLVPRRSSESPS